MNQITTGIHGTTTNQLASLIEAGPRVPAPHLNGSNGRNGNHIEPATNKEIERLENLVDNMWSNREDFYGWMMGPRSEIDKECGYPDAMQAMYYRSLYDRIAVAERIANLYPKESWQVTPTVFEDEDARNETKFEKAWDALGGNLTITGDSRFKDEGGSNIWSYLLRADILSGIGVFGVMLIGLDDGKLLEEPADGADQDGQPADITGVSEVGAGDTRTFGASLTSKDIYGGQLPRALVQPFTSTMGTDAQYFGVQFSPMQPPGSGKKDKHNLLFLRVFDESLVQVVQYEASMYNRRFGQPIMYRITLNDPRTPHTGVGLPLATVRVHWSRVIHIADNLTNSEIFGVPRMRPVLNNILDLKKLYGGSAEGYWRSNFTGLSLETHPQLGGDVIVNQAQLSNMMRNYYARMNRWISLTGMSAKTLAPQCIDPTPFINSQIEAICYHLGCPVRVFKGSERGELASSQDDQAWNDRLRHRQNLYVTPRIIVPFIDRLIKLGILPEPEEYHIHWPDLEALGEKDKAAIAFQKVQALAAYKAGDVETICPLPDLYTRVMGMDEEETDEIVEAAKKAQEEEMLSGKTPGGEPEPPAQPPTFGPDGQQYEQDDDGKWNPKEQQGGGQQGGGEGSEGQPHNFNPPPNQKGQGPPPKTKGQQASQTKQQKQPTGNQSAKHLIEMNTEKTDYLHCKWCGLTINQIKSRRVHNCEVASLFTENVFCPTGAGGGIDATCSPGGEGQSSGGQGSQSSGSNKIAAEPKTPPPPGHAFNPSVTKDSNKDGVTDTARVGVPGMSVPPPPDIGRLPNLTPHERAVEHDFITRFEQDPDKMASDFKDIVKASSKPGEPLTFGTDDAKALASAWGGREGLARSQSRATLNCALHQTANAVAKRAFVSHLDTLKPGDEVLVTVGGCGAGKGYALKNVPQALAIKGRCKAVWDSAGDQNATENPWIQKEAEKRGLKVNYIYAHANPIEQWGHPEKGVIKRAGDPRDGRMVDAQVFADSYAIGARNHAAFAEQNRGNPSASFTYLDNTGVPKLLDSMPKDALKWDNKALAKFAIRTVQRSDAPAHVKRGAMIGLRIWGSRSHSE
jgi:hypothetical protein